MRNPGPAFLLLAATLAAACADDEATWPAVRTDMGWLATSPEGTAERFCPDGGDTLDVAGRMGGLRPDTTYRVMATHTAAPGPTTLTRVEMALVAAPRTYAHEKTDPVEAVSTWAGGGCVNLRLAVRTRNEGTHYFGCIDRGVTRWPDGRQTLRLGLYHDQGSDPASFSRTLYISFDLAPYAASLRAGDTVRVELPTFNSGTVTRTVVWPAR